MPKFFCNLPFEQFTISTDGYYNVCCESTLPFDHSEKVTPLEWINSDTMKEIRNSFLSYDAREDPLIQKACTACIRREKIGINSKRNREINKVKALESLKHDTKIPNALTSKNSILLENIKKHSFDEEITQVKSMHLNGFGNHCNLQCIMCGPRSSSKWAKTALKYSEINKDMKNWTKNIHNEDSLTYWVDREILFKNDESRKKLFKSLSSFISKDLTLSIVLTGGESLINPTDQALIKYLSEHPLAKTNLVLTINTNGTIPPKVIKSIGLLNFKHVSLSISFDGMDKVYDYIRTGKSWSVYNRNMKDLHKLADQYKNLYLTQFTTIQAINVHQVPEMIKYCADNNYFLWHKNWIQDEFSSERKRNMELIGSQFRFHFLKDSFIKSKDGTGCVWFLPQHLKEKYIKKLEGVKEAKVNSIIESLKLTEYWEKDNSYIIREFLDKSSMINKIDWKEIWPELQ